MAFRDRSGREDKFSFNYRRPDPAKIKERANQQGGNFDSLFKDGTPIFTPKPGKEYRIRIMPAGWDNPEGYNYELWVHYGVGASSQRYACLDKMKGEPCPCCEEEAALRREGDVELADKLKAKKRKVPYIIDRDHESDGPQIWPAAWTTDKQIAALTSSKRTGAVKYIDDPEKGYDLEFECVKKGEYSELIGIKIDSEDSPLSDEPKQQRRWLRHISENALPEMVIYYEYDHIKKVLEGGRVKGEEDDEEKPSRKITRNEMRKRRDEESDDARDSRDKARRKHVDEDSIDEPADDDDYDDEDEDTSKKNKPASRRGDDDDEDERPAKKNRKRDEDDDDLDDDEDEPKPKAKKRKQLDSDDEEDADEDADEAPPKRSGRRQSDDEDEDEDVSPARKKTPQRSSREGSRTKGRSRDDDDDDEDLD